MASAKFLEEALSTDVDESAVNAIVGSLETQLVTSTPPATTHQVNSGTVNQNHQLNSAISNGGTVVSAVQQKHGVANGGGNTSINNLNISQQQQEAPNAATPGKSTIITTNTNLISAVNVVTSNTIVHTTSHQHQQPTTAYINQISTNANVNLSNKTQDQQQQPVKLIYPSTGQTIATSGVVNVNNRLSFPTQTVGHLPNGSLGVNLQASHNIGSISQANNQQSTNVNKQGTALVIKTSGAPGGMVSVPMSVPVSVAGNAANTTMQSKAGVTSTIVPSNVQILNVNTMRPGTPVAGQQQKQVASRVVIGQHMVGARPGAPGITLQALQGLQPGTQGHLLLKTENGQYQLLRVGPAPTQGTPGGGAVTPNSIAGGTVVPTPGTTYRIASVPATVAASVTTANTTSGTSTTVAAGTPLPAAAKVPTAQNPAQRQTTDNTKEKCRKFLANLLELSSREPKAVERNVRTLIQELIDTKVEPEEFCDRLERLLNASPQPCLIGFLKKSLPLLRQSLVTKDLVIEGIRPPPANVVFSIADNTQVAQVQNQLRPTVAVAGTGHSAGGIATTQVRVMAPITGATTMVQRPAQPIQQRLIRPVVTMVRSPTAHTVKTTVAVSGIRPVAPTVQKPPVSNVLKTAATTAQGKTINAAATLNKTVVPSLVPKPTAKEKEKKTFSSAGYTGDDDINDVAAMGGVNLAEESQRILGSTEFVGTQIRSCKDEVFLHMTPLQQRIKQIVSSYGLEEPNAEVASLISHATQERLKNLVEKLAVIAEHRIDLIKVDPRYEVTQDVRAQLKFLEELDRVERRRHEEQERELLLRAAKSRAKTEDPEQAKLKAKAKEMQRAEMEELRQREANLTALQAIGPRKKPKLDVGGSGGGAGSGGGVNSSTSGINRQMPMRPRLKRVNYRDLLFLLEQEKETCRSTTLYKSYLK